RAPCLERRLAEQLAQAELLEEQEAHLSKVGFVTVLGGGRGGQGDLLVHLSLYQVAAARQRSGATQPPRAALTCTWLGRGACRARPCPRRRQPGTRKGAPGG